ncbi:unnamed protein product [Pieris brassicae]|uniref:Uncharacterized protein n=1 Tax=Pieris brassicae TaxID=7116 RepID=A0A9P0X4P6_PIEBR|nr:unnamed protein product [Pieris brassicae]
MEVSNEIKEDIRRTQTLLKNAIQVHQIWVARLQEDESNSDLKNKVNEAEQEIVAIGRSQKLVVDRLRRELELYQQRLRAKNKQVSIEKDNHYIAQQLRDHQLQYRNRSRTTSLLKPSVLNEIQIKTENTNEDLNVSEPENETKLLDHDHINNDDMNCKESFVKNFPQLQNLVHSENSNFENALNKVKEVFLGTKFDDNDWPDRTDSDSSGISEPSLVSSPPPLPQPGEPVSKEIFMRALGLVTPSQKELMEKRLNECRKRSTSANRSDFVYGSFDMISKRKKLNHFPYLQNHNDPPQTRSAKLRKQNQSKSSREGSPSSSTDIKSWGNKPPWLSTLPTGLSVEPVFSTKKVCHGCGRNDVPSLLVWCSACSVWQHTGCGAGGRCAGCRAPLPEPTAAPSPHAPHGHKQLYSDKLAERKRLQERNIELCVELRKLEARAASLKENLDEHNAEKRQLLADQIKTQRNLQKLLDFISQFKETSVSVSESGSEVSKSNEE